MKTGCKHFAAAILTLGLVFGAGAAMAQGGFVPDGQQGAAPQAAAPALSPQAQQIYNEMMGKLITAQQALNAKQDELDQLMASPNPDAGAIKRLSREIGDLQGQALALQAEARSRFAQAGIIAPNGQQGNWGCPWAGPCWNGANGWNGGYYHHGGRHGRGHGWNGGYYGCPGMMGW